jgi:hypothetical protein
MSPGVGIAHYARPVSSFVQLAGRYGSGDVAAGRIVRGSVGDRERLGIARAVGVLGTGRIAGRASVAASAGCESESTNWRKEAAPV